MKPRRALLTTAYAVVLAVALGRVAVTHRVFSGVADEPVHISSGFDWLQRGDYTHDVTHPPLARILSAMPLWLESPEPLQERDFGQRGNELLYRGDRYVDHLAMARRGNLVLLAAGILGVAAWARLLFGEPAGLLAAAMFSMLPSLLGHAGVATTDLAVAAAFPIAGWALTRWLLQPDWPRSLAAGAALGMGALAKFSFLPFALILLAVLSVAHLLRRRDGAGAFPGGSRTALVLLTAAAAVWACYRFSFGTMYEAHDTGRVVMQLAAPAAVKPAAIWFAQNVPIPAPLYLVGLGNVAVHDRDGHLAYFFGEYRMEGWWYYFPVVLFFKTPIAFAILTFWGAAAALRRRDRDALTVLAVAAALLAFVMTSSINIGIRHVLPIYAPLSVLIAWRLVRLGQRAAAPARVAGGVLAGWLVFAGALAHPDYLAYFNEVAGPAPEKIVVDSNLDWGQDILRLEEFARQREIRGMRVALFASARLHRHLDEPAPLEPDRFTRGWIATSATAVALAGSGTERGEPYRWLSRHRPVARIGKSIKVYMIE